MAKQFSTKEQKAILKTYRPSFEDTLKESALSLYADQIKTIQINVGKICNQACHHCHVDASPIRTETMSWDVAQKCIQLIRSLEAVHTVDITGGAPEINKHFRYLVQESKKAGKHVIDRCNLTILEEKGYEYLYQFLHENEVEVIASLPHYSAMRTNQQRGLGVFERSIKALKQLNMLGYGRDERYLLNLVYNPSGMFLSGEQEQLEREFKENLYRDHGIEFHHLYCLNNLPISRFLSALLRRGKLEEYMRLLKSAFNPHTVNNLMCRHQISIGYEGTLYDCDFNQMLELPSQPIGHLDQWQEDVMNGRLIVTGNHCYGCTAGAGSSCGGSLM